MASLQPQSDVGVLWNQALADYQQTTEVDIRQHLKRQSNISSIMEDQEHRLANFENFRHNKGKRDRIRSIISENARLIQGIPISAVDAVCLTFPPASAVLAAFTFVMTASKHMSDDYDMIEGFFETMKGFLQRLSFLENRLPPQEAIQKLLIKVFSSLLTLSGIASSYCAKGRLSKLVRDLVDGGDPKLADAYAKLNSDLSQLESAVLMLIWRSTIEISAHQKSTDERLAALQDRNEIHHHKTMQSLERIDQIASRSDAGVQELLKRLRSGADTRHEPFRNSDHAGSVHEKSQSMDNASKSRIMKAGASRPMIFERIKKELLAPGVERDIARSLTDIRSSYVEDVFDWIDQEPAFQSIANGESSLLWVNGTSGMGKTTLSFVMLRYLERMFASAPKVSVTWFSFDGDFLEMRSMGDMLRYCCIRAAMNDTNYCRELSEALRRSGPLETDEEIWSRLIEPRYPAKSDRRLIIILDGIDEASIEEFTKLVTILGRIRTQECTVQAIFTCGPDKEKDVSVLKAKCIELTRDKVIRDMHKFASSRTKNLPRLKRLRQDVQRKVVRKVMDKADSFLYIEHALQRLNAIGREGTIQKELRSLADSTTALYRTILADCLRNRTTEDQESLRRLFAWLAYTKASFTIAEANCLVGLMQTNEAISMEEELDGRLSRLLRITGDEAANEEDHSSADDDKAGSMTETDSDTEGVDDGSSFLSFQERSLKAHFCRAIEDQPDDVRCGATEAHVIIFQMCSAILTMPKVEISFACSNLQKYAAQRWLFHLQKVTFDDNGDMGGDLIKVVLESMYKILTNKHESLKPLEEDAQETGSILSGNGTTQDVALKTLSAWAQHASTLGSGQLPREILSWYRPLAQEPLQVFIGLSRAHVENWFAATSQRDAFSAFKCAHNALQEVRRFSKLNQPPSIDRYFDDFTSRNSVLTERSFEVVANYFEDVKKTPSSYKGVGMAMKYAGMYEPAIEQLNKGLKDETTDTPELFKLLSSKGQGLLELGFAEIETEKRKEYLEQSIAVYEQANITYQQMGKAKQLEGDLLRVLCLTLQNMACAVAFLGQCDKALTIFWRALETKEHINIDIIANLIVALKRANQPSMIIEVLSRITKRDVAVCLIWIDGEIAQEAAVQTSQGQLLLDLYQRAQKTLKTWPIDSKYKDEYMARLQSIAAKFAHQALRNPELAKKLFEKMIDHPRSPDWRVIEGCNRIAEILFERFRLSKLPSTKKQALDETKTLLQRLEAIVPDYYNPESHITVTVALMLKRLGPTEDFFARLDDAFQNCLRELQDDTGTNDASALRHLAKVISCIPGFEEDASISLTAQFYIIDEDVRRKDLEKRRISSAGATAYSNIEEDVTIEDSKPKISPKEALDPSVAAKPIDAPSIRDVAVGSPKRTNCRGPNHESTPESDDEVIADVAAQTPSVESEMETGLLPDNEAVSCDICGKLIWDLSDGAVYYCMYCIDCDICEGCFSKKNRQDKGELERAWRVVCPKGHRHIKAPIEGWRGVKNGMMRIGTNEIPFKLWLKQLEDRWKDYWEKFWSETDVDWAPL